MFTSKREPRCNFCKLNFHPDAARFLLIRSWKTGERRDDDTRCMYTFRPCIEKVRRGTRPKYRIFFCPSYRETYTTHRIHIYIYKANLDPKLLPEPSFHPRRILFFLFSLFSPREIL